MQKSYFFKVYPSLFAYSIFWILFFLVFNTSFNIMGVDVGDYLKQFASAYFGIALFAFFKVFSTFLVFNLVFGSLFYDSLKSIQSTLSHRKILFLTLVFLLSTQLLAMMHSFIQFPQLYGEFFFYRYQAFAPVLYFLTDFLTPSLFQFLLFAIYISLFGTISFQALRLKKTNFRLLLFGWILAFLIHAEGSVLFLFFLAVVFPILLNEENFKNGLGSRWEKGAWASLTIVVVLLNSNFFLSILPSQNPNTNVLILSTDSLRYDKLGFVSGNKEITPHLDEFAKSSLVFHDHHTTVPRTFPSWADLMTGKFSMSHKVRDMFPSPEEKANIGSERFPTIPQKLSNQGFTTAVIGSFAGDIFPRANFGFQKTIAPNFNAKVMTIQRTVESQLLLLPILTGSYLYGGNYIEEVLGLSTWGDGARLVRSLKNTIGGLFGSKFFLTYFSSVVHFPYTPSYPYYKKFTNPDYYGKYKYLKFVDPTNSEKPTQEEVKQIRGLFDSSVFAFDAEFGEIIEFLKAKELYDNTLIIVTSDHGEALYEDIHGQGHGEHLRGEAVTKIPLLVKFPKELPPHITANLQRTGDIHSITSSIDLFPTLMEFFKIDFKQEDYPGVSLLEIVKNPNLYKDRMVYTETGIWFSDRGDQFFQNQRIPYPNILELHNVIPEEDYQIMITDPVFQETISFAKHRAILNKNYKLIYIPTREGVKWELYDRNADSFNTQNLYPKVGVSEKMKENLYFLVRRWERSNVVGEYLLPPNSSDF